MTNAPKTLWTPSTDEIERSQMGQFRGWMSDRLCRRFDDYWELWEYSVVELEPFWASLAAFFSVDVSEATRVLESEAMFGADWFPGARLNYAELALAGEPTDVAILARSQTRAPLELSRGELREQVARVRASLEQLGIRRGDRIATVLPNIPEVVVIFLAAASLGAVFTSCAPEMGQRSIVARLRQIGPMLLVGVDGYRYGEHVVDCRDQLKALVGELPSVCHTVVVSYIENDHQPAYPFLRWSDLLTATPNHCVERLPFDHPLYILYSSGTTGQPKAIVHGHGGIVLEHLKWLGLHTDVGHCDRLFWFTTTGWMAWNASVSALLCGAAVVLFDGNPNYPGPQEYWRVVAETGTTHLGTSPVQLANASKIGLRPREVADLSELRSITSGGAPLAESAFHWVYDAVGDDLQLSSASGGTEICSAFVGGAPLLPVQAGRIACRLLGAKVEAYNDSGESVVGERGELVVAKPMPSMPLWLWGDDDGSRYRDSYFSRFEGVWVHGDWVTIYPDGGLVVSGRSDATLNRGGVRMGTSEYYEIVERVDGVDDSLVVHVDDHDGGPGRLVLLVVMKNGRQLDESLRERIVGAVRTGLSPRFIPDEVIQVPAIPRTTTGKRMEVGVKRALMGTPVGVALPVDDGAEPGAVAAVHDIVRRLAPGRRSHGAAGMSDLPASARNSPWINLEAQEAHVEHITNGAVEAAQDDLT